MANVVAFVDPSAPVRPFPEEWTEASLDAEVRALADEFVRYLDEDTLLDLDAEGKICGITVEHAKNRIEDIPHVSFEEVAV